MSIYKVGDRPWHATFNVRREVRVPCPVCSGKCQVVVILGNGEHIATPCDYCTKGYEGPRGWVHEYEVFANAERERITAVEIRETADGETREYRSSHFLLRAEDLFDTEEEARARAQEKANEQLEIEETRADYLKKDKVKSFAWNVGYHRRNAKRCREEAEQHERKAVLCEARVPKT